MSGQAFKLSRKLLAEFKLESSFVISIELEVFLKVITFSEYSTLPHGLCFSDLEDISIFYFVCG